MFLLLFLMSIIGIFILSTSTSYNTYKYINSTSKLYCLVVWILKGYILFLFVIIALPLIHYLSEDSSLLLLITYTLLSQHMNISNMTNKHKMNRKNNYEYLSLQSSILGKDFLLYKLLYGSTSIGLWLALPLFANVIVYSMIGEVPAVNLNGELQELLSEATRLFSQLNTFISQFHNFVNETGINVVTDGYGSLGVDVVESVSDATAQGYANRINVFDSLIHDRVHTIEELIDRISDLELQIIQSDNDYTSQLPQLRARLANLVRSYGHIHS